MLSVAGVARSTFFYHLKVQAQPDKYESIKQQIKNIYHQHKGRYGYRRITATLRHNGHMINHKTVQHLMQKLKLKCCVRVKRYRSYKGAIGKVADNLLQRQFQAKHPNEKWVTDVTEFNVRGDKLYLSPILDLYNSEIISYRIANRPEFDMVKHMLLEATDKLKPQEKPLLHSDQGWQYQMQPFQRLLKQHQIRQSMSRKGNCLDNAVMENFFGILKSECFYTRKFESVEQLKQSLHKYIHYYNHDRIKMKLKGLSPVQYRIQSLQAA